MKKLASTTPSGLPTSTPAALRRWGPRAWGPRSAVLMLIGSLSVSAAGQAKTGVTANNHTSSVATVTPVGSKGTRVRVLARSGNAGDEIPAAPPTRSDPKSHINENVEAPLKSGTPVWGNAAVNLPAESSRPRASIKATSSDSAIAAVRPGTLGATLTAGLTQVYRVGIGDVLDVQLPQIPSNKSTLFTVLEGGVLEYPLVRDPILVTGLTTDEIALLLRQQMKIFDNPTVVVNVRDYASHSVTVSGLVSVPGIKILRREAVPLYVVISQSLPPPEARRATIVRPGRQPVTVDLEDSKESSTLVIPGDIIKVSALPVGHSEFFFAGGEINSPGQKPYHAGLTLTQAILASGGLSKNAGTKVLVSRQAPDGRLVRIEYNLQNIQSGKTADPSLEKGDRVQVRLKG